MSFEFLQLHVRTGLLQLAVVSSLVVRSHLYSVLVILSYDIIYVARPLYITKCLPAIHGLLARLQ